jgi:formylglycine-generating enzyme required for sulfatase activity
MHLKTPLSICLGTLLLGAQACRTTEGSAACQVAEGPHTTASTAECSGAASRAPGLVPSEVRRPPTSGMAFIAGGQFLMGTDQGFPYEGPARRRAVSSFWIDLREVTVTEFARFVEATGYRTEAQTFGSSVVFDTVGGGWLLVEGADWLRPDGPRSQAAPDEPVTQVSWNDAVAYARWAGKRLPTEAEWEYAARGGLEGARYAWGDELRPSGKYLANFWQGTFPERDSGEDGFRGRAPVGAYPPNDYGLFDVTGNVWEWCADAFTGAVAADQAGAERAIRGGSWLCAEGGCRGFRVAARSHAPAISAMNNLGFRCARDAAPDEREK